MVSAAMEGEHTEVKRLVPVIHPGIIVSPKGASA